MGGRGRTTTRSSNQAWATSKFQTNQGYTWRFCLKIVRKEGRESGKEGRGEKRKLESSFPDLSSKHYLWWARGWREVGKAEGEELQG